MADAVEAIDYAVAHGASVINCSWGTDEESLLLKDAIARAAGSGVVVVTSAGNDGRDLDQEPYYPSSFRLPNLVAVAATDHFDQLAAWSNRGAATVMLAAPGADILTTKMGGGYQVVSGTSAAGPLVAGVAALVETARPYLSAADIITALKAGGKFRC